MIWGCSADEVCHIVRSGMALGVPWSARRADPPGRSLHRAPTSGDIIEAQSIKKWVVSFANESIFGALMECWASPLGHCSAKASREHLVTDGIWNGPDIEVVGLPWCRHTPVRPGRANIVAKILCSAHNSALSPVDAAAIRAFQALRGAAELYVRRRRFPSPQLTQRCFGIDGPLLERWFIKTAINFALAQHGAVRWHLGSAGRTPPVSLVEAAFGRSSLPAGAGLYAAAKVGESGLGSESVHFEPVYDADDSLAAALFRFYGFRFLLSLREGQLPSRISISEDKADLWHSSELMFHIQRLRFAQNGLLSHWVYFDWPDRLSAHFTE